MPKSHPLLMYLSRRGRPPSWVYGKLQNMFCLTLIKNDWRTCTGFGWWEEGDWGRGGGCENRLHPKTRPQETSTHRRWRGQGKQLWRQNVPLLFHTFQLKPPPRRVQIVCYLKETTSYNWTIVKRSKYEIYNPHQTLLLSKAWYVVYLSSTVTAIYLLFDSSPSELLWLRRDWLSSPVGFASRERYFESER